MVIQFDASLGDQDWVATLGGWRCEALQISGARNGKTN